MWGLPKRKKPPIVLQRPGIAEFQERVQQGLHQARQQVDHERAAWYAARIRDVPGSTAVPPADIRYQTQRANEIIAAIPGLAAASAKAYFRRGWRLPLDDFDCQFSIMTLIQSESRERHDDYVFHNSWSKESADSTKILGAARIVFDFCLQAGYNPVVVSRPGRHVGDGFWFGRFEIDLRLNVAPEPEVEQPSVGGGSHTPTQT